MTRTPWMVGIAVTGLVLAIILAGCGVPVDDQPQQIDVPSRDSLGPADSFVPPKRQ